MYSIDDLKTFVAIAGAQGVTAGAKRVGISPATASHRLNKLEAALKITLFHRNSRMFELTDSGQIFLERTRSILAELMQAERDAGSGSTELIGHVRMTMAPWVLSRFIIPALPSFREKHPKLTFEFLAVDRFVSLAAEGQDCAIRIGKLSDSALVARKLCNNERIICASPDFLNRNGELKDIRDLAEADWVCLPWQTKLNFCDTMQKRKAINLRASVLVSNSDTLTDAVLQGLGLAIKSRLAVKNELKEGNLIEVLPGALWQPDAPIWFVYRPEARASLKTEVCSQFASMCFEQVDDN